MLSVLFVVIEKCKKAVTLLELNKKREETSLPGYGYNEQRATTGAIPEEVVSSVRQHVSKGSFVRGMIIIPDFGHTFGAVALQKLQLRYIGQLARGRVAETTKC